MTGSDRRDNTRKPLPVGVYLVVDGVRHPGTLRDLSSGGAGFADPVLAVRLDLVSGKRVEVEIPGDLAGEEALRLPGTVAHVAGGIRPRLGIRFGVLDGDAEARLMARLGRPIEDSSSGHPGDGALDGEEGRDLRFVLVEPTRTGNQGRALLTTFALGAVVVLALLLLLYVVSLFG